MPLEAEKRAKFRKGFAFNVLMLTRRHVDKVTP